MMRLNTLLIGGILVASVSFAASCSATEPTIYKIEEDWRMVVHQPDATTNSPQVTFYTSPSVHSDDIYFQLQMNHAADANFSVGGFHVAAVQGDSILDEARSATQAALSTDGDVVRWTNVMAVSDGRVLFAVKDGHGNQWGSFGGPEYLVQLSSSPVADLSEYHPQQSLDTVDIGFGANRVSSITLCNVRLYYSDGQITTVVMNQSP